MLQESRLYSFIDQANGFALHFLEGQKLIHDVALTHNLQGPGFHFFRDALLSFQQLISYLKPGEGVGIYLDSEDPYFRFKIEFSKYGNVRTLLLPEDFNQFPTTFIGTCRQVKTIPNELHPYTSMIDLVNIGLDEVVNKILKDSYQFQSKIFLSADSDQSIMLLKLPAININKIQTQYSLSIEEYWQKYESNFIQIFNEHSQNVEEIKTAFLKLGLLFLNTKDIIFKCSCSRDRMVKGITSIIRSSGIDHVFLPGETEIETKCDYCKTTFILKKAEFLN